MNRIRLFGLIGCGLVLFALTEAGLAVHPTDINAEFVAVATAQGAVYLLALRVVSPLPGSRSALALVLGAAAAMRLVVLLAPPFLSTDIYRYVWDGRVIAAGINPYRYIPADPHLAPLRDAEIYPEINRGSYARTIYPPAAQAIFFVATRIGETLTVMKAAMVLFETVAIVLLLQLLAAAGEPSHRIIVYTWHPLPLWEFAGSGHIDAAVVAFVALALWARQRPPASGPWLTGLALAIATLVKLYPAVLFPALWRRWDWRMPTAFIAVIILGYLPFLGVGWHVFGFLPHYVEEEGFTGSGGGFYLWSLVKLVPGLAGLPDAVYLAAVFAILAVLAAWLAFRRGGFDGSAHDAALIAGIVMLLWSPHYAWYFAWLVVFACLLPSAALLWLTLTSFLLYLVPVGSQLVRGPQRLLVESVIYLPFAALAATEAWRHRRREQPRHDDDASS